MKTVVTGATGIIGKAFLPHLDYPTILSRTIQKEKINLNELAAFPWQPMAEPAPAAALEGAEVVIHLAGEPVAAGRWTQRRKALIRDSRVLGTRHLVAGIAACTDRPKVLISASAVGLYGDRGAEELTEQATAGDDFLAQVCGGWEREAMAAQDLGLRVVCVRLGVVLARGGGALQKMLPPFRLGLGGRLGSGQQWMSWVHIDDVVGMILHAAHTPTLRGPMNVTAPTPVTNADFTQALAKVLHRPAVFPVPGLALRAMVGEMADMLLGGQRVRPTAAQESGYTFHHPDLEAALRTILAQGTAQTTPAPGPPTE